MCDLVSYLEGPRIKLQQSLLFWTQKFRRDLCNGAKLRPADLESGEGSEPLFSAV